MRIIPHSLATRARRRARLARTLGPTFTAPEGSFITPFAAPGALFGRDDNDSVTVVDSTSVGTTIETDKDKTITSEKTDTVKVTSTLSSSSSTSTSSSSSSDSSSSTSSTLSTSSSSTSTSSTTSSSSAAATSSTSSATLTSSSASATTPGQATSSFLRTSLSSSATHSSTTPSTSAGSATSNTTSAAAKSPLSTGAIIGISVGGGALILLLLVYIIRKRFLRRKERRLDAWLGASDEPKPALDSLEKIVNSADIASPPLASSPTVSRNPSIPAPAAPPPPPKQYMLPSQQMAMMNNPHMAGVVPGSIVPNMGYAPQASAYPSYPPHNPYAPSPTPSSVPLPPAAVTAATSVPPPGIPPALQPRTRAPRTSVAFALVRAGFMPTLADELAVQTNEMVHVLEEYDDGWALCANLRGDRGVVPMEHLQRGAGVGSMGAQPQPPRVLIGQVSLLR